MRVKQVWDYFPLPQKAKLVWNRLTFSKLTTAYLLFSLLHCLIQLALQVRAFTINETSARDLFAISQKADTFNTSVPFRTGSQLLLCPDVPTALHGDVSECAVVWNGTAVYNNVTSSQLNEMNMASSSSSPSVSTSASASSAFLQSTSTSLAVSSPASSTRTSASGTVVTKTVTRLTTTTPTPTSTTDDDDDDDDDDRKGAFKVGDDNEEGLWIHHKRQNPDLGVMVADLGGRPQVNITDQGVTATLSSNCSWALNYPVSVLDNTKREDVTFMAFQIWVLGMSIVALLNESIPHIIASLLTHIMATGWAAFQIVNTKGFQEDFAKVITHGACSGVPDLLGTDYWKGRQDAEYASLALNVVALFVSGFLSWKLFKSFGWLTFKRVGASLTINRIYKLVLVLSIVLQLSFFFMGATVALWIDSLINGVAAAHGEHVKLYQTTSFLTMFLLLPWISAGYIGVRKELRLSMIIFLLLSILYLAAWSFMFLADTFRWEYWSWQFFGAMATFSVALTVLAFILGIVCIMNFGKGLLRYLSAQTPLPGDDFAPVTYGSDPEKVAFPSNRQPIPTFSATFGKGSEVPVPSEMFPSRAQMGPRFFRSAEPFDSRSVSPITVPSMTHTRSSVASTETPVEGHSPSMMRSNTRASENSFHSIASYYQYSDDGQHNRSGSQHTMQGKRWVIE